MSRFTDENKWDDKWFYNLSVDQKLLFIYFCDKCDIAGFMDYIPRKISCDTGVPEGAIEGACKGLAKSIIIRTDVLWVVNFIHHQKNLPLNKSNKCHIGIIRRLSARIEQFPEIENLIPKEGATKGLNTPTGKGIGNSKGIGEGNPEETAEKELNDFLSFFASELGKSDIRQDAELQRRWFFFFKENHSYSPDDLRTAIRAAKTDEWFMSSRAGGFTPHKCLDAEFLSKYLNYKPQKPKYGKSTLPPLPGDKI